MNKRQRKKWQKKYGWPAHLFHYDKKFYNAIAGPGKEKKKGWLWWVQSIVVQRDMRIPLKIVTGGHYE